MRCLALLAPILILAGCHERPATPAPSRLVIWAWERPEDLRFARDTEIAVQTGFIEIGGRLLRARGRYFPLKSTTPPAAVLVHVQIDRAAPLRWSPALRAQLAAATRFYATATPAKRVRLDFEVRKSERQILLDTLADLRRALPPRTSLSTTALASWCMDDDWLQSAPVDEIVPMLFRMQKDGPAIVKTLANGGDFPNPRCRAALAISSDSPTALDGMRAELGGAEGAWIGWALLAAIHVPVSLAIEHGRANPLLNARWLGAPTSCASPSSRSWREPCCRSSAAWQPRQEVRVDPRVGAHDLSSNQNDQDPATPPPRSV